jgi:transcriptional regulator with XRE-family HTH domain
MKKEKTANKTDQEVGRRLKTLRIIRHVSQEALGDKLGITFQQIQKYEKGKNRISASRLHAIAQTLEVPVTYFFDERAETTPGGGGEYVAEFLADARGLALARAFTRVERPEVRKAITKLVRAVAGA